MTPLFCLVPSFGVTEIVIPLERDLRHLKMQRYMTICVDDWKGQIHCRMTVYGQQNGF